MSGPEAARMFKRAHYVVRVGNGTSERADLRLATSSLRYAERRVRKLKSEGHSARIDPVLG